MFESLLNDMTSQLNGGFIQGQRKGRTFIKWLENMKNISFIRPSIHHISNLQKDM